MELKEKNKVYIGGKGILTATKAGTRKLGPYEEVLSPGGKLLFKGRRIIESGEVVAVIETPNIICDEGLLLIAGFTIDESATYDTGLTYCEIGTDDTAPTAGDTTLGAFSHRNAVTNDSAAESTVFIKEAGIWGGGDADGTEANGLLFAHWLASFDNGLGAYDITITYVLTVARG